MKFLQLSLILFCTFIFSSCGSSGDDFKQITVSNWSQKVLLDTKKNKELSAIQKIFYAKKEAADGIPDLRYRLEIITKDNSQRWQYGIKGYLRNYDTNAKLYRVKEVAKFNRLLHIKET